MTLFCHLLWIQESYHHANRTARRRQTKKLRDDESVALSTTQSEQVSDAETAKAGLTTESNTDDVIEKTMTRFTDLTEKNLLTEPL